MSQLKGQDLRDFVAEYAQLATWKTQQEETRCCWLFLTLLWENSYILRLDSNADNSIDLENTS